MNILSSLGIVDSIKAVDIVTVIGVVSGILTILTSFLDFPRKKITFKIFLIISLICFVFIFVLIRISKSEKSEDPPIQNNPIPSPSESVEPNSPEKPTPTDSNIKSDNQKPSSGSKDENPPTQNNPIPSPSESVEPSSPEKPTPTDANIGSDNSESSENLGDNLIIVDIDPETVALENVAWLEEENIHSDDTATTTRGETWSNCIRFGTNNLNADGDSYIVAVCDQKYSKFTAKIAPQKGFDHSEIVILRIYGVCSDNDELIFCEEYQISNSTKAFEVELDITGVDDLYFYKDGDYSLAKIAEQYLKGYTGMGVLMCDAVLYK